MLLSPWSIKISFQVVEISDEQLQAPVCMYQQQAPWGLVRTTWNSWPPTSYDYHFGTGKIPDDNQ